jgi:hypothetical protein
VESENIDRDASKAAYLSENVANSNLNSTAILSTPWLDRGYFYVN